MKMGYLKTEEDGFRVGSYFQAKALNGWLAERPGDPLEDGGQEDLPVGQADPSTLLQSVLALYKVFLDTAQKGKRLANPGECVYVAHAGGNAHLQESQARFEAESKQAKSWRLALDALLELLSERVERKQSWSLFRLFELAEQTHPVDEQEFIDLMSIVSEEAALDSVS